MFIVKDNITLEPYSMKKAIHVNEYDGEYYIFGQYASAKIGLFKVLTGQPVDSIENFKLTPLSKQEGFLQSRIKNLSYKNKDISSIRPGDICCYNNTVDRFNSGNSCWPKTFVCREA